ncbi:MAG: amino acid adenylation domain-containing protein [Moorea sp. SIO1G6]|uniref:non-ribosomal peptide synthetase family protein n=1 Tax=Moorena sp. SIO1G6 TaxID=2607840 RepID=UPI0013BF39BC|nr:non-ribosomal peptide synthetase [Moorena sp. SIO1G6]NET66950.1 amino acid adenylation domain-containing protein [Moorena sp. SIO1G6]
MDRIPQLFEAQVERTPDTIAVVCDNQQLTYRELNGKANQLASYLRSLGVEPETLVGICVERSLDTVVGLLGILKAGGAYVPLDPSYPSERLEFMLHDTQVSVLLTQQKLVAEIPEYQGHLVCLDTDWQKIAVESNTNPVGRVGAENLAYITYTSGSTGKPKGAMMPHRAVCQSWRWLQETFPFVKSDRILHKASLSFDVSSRWELFWPLMAGASVVLAKPDGEKDSAYIVRLIAQEQITVAYFVSSMLSIFLEDPDLKTCRNLRRIFVGGEAFPFALKQRFWERLPNCEAIEIYGSTETIVVSSWNCQPEPEPRNFSITRPIANLPIYILDQQMQPVPRGETGELYVGGDYLVRGYLNRPELTAEKFITNPFENSKVIDAKAASRRVSQKSKLYKTGDLARYLFDGNIELLGRGDHQVKIRGFRIELGEIEGVLIQHPVVRQAAVIAREDIPGDKRLVAYIVSTLGDESRTAIVPELRRLIQAKLPEYMLPAAFIVLEELPLNPNGKLDRRSLPAPNPERPILEQEFVPPRTSLETKLAQLWSQVLHIHPIGLRDNFFELGGNSLLAIRLLFQVRHAFGVDFPLRTLLEAPTVANMAEVIDKFSNSEEVAGIESMTVEELLSEAVLDPTIKPNFTSVGSYAEPNAIFLTGATGFLGAFLLDELLRQTQARIYCLVRGCKTTAEGKQKITKNLDRYLLEYESFNSRIIPVIGDLSQSLLGLHDQQFEELGREIDIIYHAATFLNLAYPYTAMRAANVGGTQEILRLASQIKLKSVHFISSPAIFKSTGYFNKPSIREEDPLEDCEVVYGGYAQSKWVAEKLLKTAHSFGIPVSIYRPGTISGHSKTGASNAEQTLGRLLKSFVEQGIAPDLNIEFDLTPVDYVSQAIVDLSRQKESLGKSFHLVNPQCLQIGELVDLIRSIGYPIEQIDYPQWESKMRDVILNYPENVLSPILPFLTKKIPGTQLTYLEASSFTSKLDCENTVKGLAKSGITCAPPDSQLLRVYLRHIEEFPFSM